MKRIGLILPAILLVAFQMFSQNVNIPDANFLNALIELGVDKNGDGMNGYAEAEAVTSLNFEPLIKNISSLTGIESFVNLGFLYCSGNQLTSLYI